MVEAIVLIQVAVGESSPVAGGITKLDGVRSADVVTGPYDVIARVAAKSVDELGQLVISRIQAVPGVTRTLTCPVVRF